MAGAAAQGPTAERFPDAFEPARRAGRRRRVYPLIVRGRLDYRYRAACHADGTILLVGDPDRPHLSRTSNMNRLCDRPNRAVSLGANVVCVDLDADGGELRRIYIRERTERRGRLGQGDRCAAVEQAKRLPGPIVHGHRRDDPRGC